MDLMEYMFEEELSDHLAIFLMNHSNEFFSDEEDHPDLDSMCKEPAKDPPLLRINDAPPHRRVLKPWETGMNTAPRLGRFAARRLRKLRNRRVLPVSLKKLIRASKRRRQAHRPSANDMEHPMLIQTRVVLRSQGRLPADSLAVLHKLYRTINDKTSQAFSLFNAVMGNEGWKYLGGRVGTSKERAGTVEVSFLTRMCKLRVRTEETLFQAAKSQIILGTGDINISYKLDRFLEDFFDTWGMPTEAEVALLARIHRASTQAINAWFVRKEKRIELVKIEYFKEWIMEKWRSKLQYRRTKPPTRL